MAVSSVNYDVSFNVKSVSGHVIIRRKIKKKTNSKRVIFLSILLDGSPKICCTGLYCAQTDRGHKGYEKQGENN